jgi:hypothetical protein
LHNHSCVYKGKYFCITQLYITGTTQDTWGETHVVGFTYMGLTPCVLCCASVVQLGCAPIITHTIITYQDILGVRSMHVGFTYMRPTCMSPTPNVSWCAIIVHMSVVQKS